MKTYQITFKNQLRALYPIILIEVLFISLLIYLYEPTNGFYFYLQCTGILFFILFCFVIFLHLQYYNRNKYTIVKIDEEQNEIKISPRGGDFVLILPAEIKKIEFHLSYGTYYNWSYRNLPFDDYHYCKIFLNNNKSYILTSLLAENLDFMFKNINVSKERNLRFYNNIK